MSANDEILIETLIKDNICGSNKFLRASFLKYGLRVEFIVCSNYSVPMIYEPTL